MRKIKAIKALAIYDRPNWAIHNLWQTVAEGAARAKLPLEIETLHAREDTTRIWQAALNAHIVILNFTGDANYLRQRLPRLWRLKIAQMIHSCDYETDVEKNIALADIVAVASERVARKHDLQTEFVIPSAAGRQFRPDGRSEPRSGNRLRVGQFGNKRNQGKNWDMLRAVCDEFADIEFVTDDEHRTALQMARLYRSLDVYVCASKSEGSNVCIAEARACSVPVITTRTGTAEFHVDEGVTGWFIETDNAESLRERLRWCLDNRHKLSEMRAASAAKARAYSAADMARRAYEWLATMPPLASVVIPCYNYALYLPDAVNSVLNQNFRDYEIIIVNDASTDDTRQVAAKLTKLDERIRVINLRKNRGLPGARNKGILEARGKYILPLDADDRLSAGALRALAEEMLVHNRGDVVYGDIQVCGDHNKLLRLPEYSVQELLVKNILPYAALFPKRAWQCANGYKTEMGKAGGWEDYEFWLELAERGYYGQRIDRVTLEYRRHGRSMLHDAEENKPKLRELLMELHGDYYRAVQQPAPDVPIKYIGTQRRPFFVTGKITGREYQFSPRHARQFVSGHDAPALLETGDYKPDTARPAVRAAQVKQPRRKG